MTELLFNEGRFSQGGINSSTGEERETTLAVRTDFAEIPVGLQNISTTVSVGRMVWKYNEKEYEYVEKTTDTSRYVYFYDKNKNFIDYAYSTKNTDFSVDISTYLTARYVRFSVNLSSDRLYPTIEAETSGSYYYLENFLIEYDVVQWKYSKDNKLIHDDLKIAPLKNITEPYPKALWSTDVNSATATHELLPNIAEKAISKPYPQALWRVEKKISDMPFHELLPFEKPLGAFMGAEKLKYVYIPDSVRKIGRFAFSGTALESVKIHPDCEFFETSFPENCIIKFYN
ncbi:MAG: leucine-rich repeat domain-containing protein [Ruminococcus sp.]|nr:leucine-rich repeat domain-containing protein [Ruminococcus sp.]